MTGQTIEVVKGDVEVTPAFSDVVPTAAAEGARVGEAQFRLIKGDERLARSTPKAKDDAPRSLDPYWQISNYTEAEINAIREADKLDPDLAERYKDLLED